MKDAYIVPFFVYGTLTFSLLLVIIVMMIMRHNKNRYKYLAEKKNREYEYRNELLNAQVELQEHLLSQVAREIHDNVGQVLSLVKVHLFTVSNLVKDERPLYLVETSAELLNKAIEDLRRISHAQNADILHRTGLQEALRKELDYIRGLKNQQCEIEVYGDPYAISPEAELVMYRIAQEAIHNSIKHAGASMLHVSLAYETNSCTLVITDNGKGFSTTGNAAGAGVGISHMLHRARLLGASLDIASEIDRGTTVTLKMPIHLYAHNG